MRIRVGGRIDAAITGVGLVLATVVVGWRLRTVGDFAWFITSPRAGQGTLTLSYIFILLVAADFLMLMVVVNTWRRKRRLKNQRAT